MTEVSIFRPRSQFFPLRTDHKPVNNLFIFSSNGQAHQGANQRRISAGRFSLSKRFMKVFENIWQSSETFGNLRQSSETFGNLRKQFKSVFHRFYDVLKFSENLRKSSENFENGSKVIFRCFYDFLKFFEI